jgi:cell wall-associated NlpC family hydrolase
MCRRLSTHLVVLVLLLAFPAAAAAVLDRSDDGAKPAPPAEMLPTTGDKAVGIALRYLGTPYSWAGASPAGFDCSGFVMYVYGKLGIGLPHSSSALWNVGRPVARHDLEGGDIVLFNGLSHVGIYVGNGTFIHSPHSGDVVKISRFSDDWYGSTFEGARRVG